VLLAEASALDLVAVTTVAGDTRLRARIAARMLGLADRTDVEVFVGEREALLRQNRFPAWPHLGKGLLEGPDAPVRDEPAPDRIVRAAREHDGQLELLAVGPMTNLARALALDPDLPGRVSRLWVMGGHVRRAEICGRPLPYGIDYNLCSDPEASVAVLGAGFDTTLVTADVTLQTWLRPADVQRLSGGSLLGRALAAHVELWSPVQRALFTGLAGAFPDDNEAYLHDPLAALAMVDPASLTFESLRIVTTLERGVLRTFEAPSEDTPAASMRVATAVDACVAEQAIIDRVTRV
jgi:purine nucleosidase